MTKKPCIIHSTPGVGRASFGVGQVALNLMNAQCELGYDSKVWCVSNTEDVNWAISSNGLANDRIESFSIIGPKRLSFSPAMLRATMSENIKIDIAHQHGIWTGISYATLKIHQNRNIPTIIAPHGSLSSWALNTSKLKKKLALSMYENENLKQASCLHATSVNEITDFRNFGLKNPIAYIDNGIHEKFLKIEGCADRFFLANGIDPNKRILLFLSRISPKKGLDMLIEAISIIKDDFADWQLIIAGMDEFNYKVHVESLIKQMKLENKIKIIGTLFDQSKADAFAAAELFILPSYSEGSPMIVLESLAAGVPVITTKASAWNDLKTHNCGWWTEICTPSIADSLIDAIMNSKEDLNMMGLQGRNLIESKYIWSHSAKQTILLYEWLLGYSDKPDFVFVD